MDDLDVGLVAFACGLSTGLNNALAFVNTLGPCDASKIRGHHHFVVFLCTVVENVCIFSVVWDPHDGNGWVL